MSGTAKGRALGAALRKVRTDRGLGLRELARKLNRQPGVLSSWETAARRPKPDQVSQILTTLGVTGKEYDEIIDLAYHDDSSPWVATSVPEQRQQLNALIDFERNASKLTYIAPLLIPGLLQTSGYIHAIMSAGGVPTSEIASRAALRLGRKETITREANPVLFEAYVCTQALTHVIGGTATMVEQVKHILQLAIRPNITVRAVRPDCGWHPALEGQFILIDFADTASLVHLETRKSGLFLHEPEEVSAYQRAVKDTDKVSYGEQETFRIFDDIARRMETTHRESTA
jgi:transcriptional regulator with XRE-family HTH domain